MASNSAHCEILPYDGEENTMFIRIHRPIYTQTEFEKNFEAHKRNKKTLKARLAYFRNCQFFATLRRCMLLDTFSTILQNHGMQREKQFYGISVYAVSISEYAT